MSENDIFQIYKRLQNLEDEIASLEDLATGQKNEIDKLKRELAQERYYQDPYSEMYPRFFDYGKTGPLAFEIRSNGARTQGAYFVGIKKTIEPSFNITAPYVALGWDGTNAWIGTLPASIDYIFYVYLRLERVDSSDSMPHAYIECQDCSGTGMPPNGDDNTEIVTLWKIVTNNAGTDIDNDKVRDERDGFNLPAMA